MGRQHGIDKKIFHSNIVKLKQIFHLILRNQFARDPKMFDDIIFLDKHVFMTSIIISEKNLRY